jgi:hypothetical protein
MHQHKWLMWTARISGLLITVLFAGYLINEVMPDISSAKSRELFALLPFTLLSFFGFFVAWFKPAPGGRILMAGALLLAGYFLFNGHLTMAMVYGLPSLLVGLCFLAAANKQLV